MIDVLGRTNDVRRGEREVGEALVFADDATGAFDGPAVLVSEPRREGIG